MAEFVRLLEKHEVMEYELSGLFTSTCNFGACLLLLCILTFLLRGLLIDPISTCISVAIIGVLFTVLFGISYKAYYTNQLKLLNKYIKLLYNSLISAEKSYSVKYNTK